MTRLVFRGRTVICKEPLGADAPRRLRHEVAMLERLRGVVGVAQLVEAPRYPGCIVLADAGRTSLDDVAKPLAVDELIALALALASAVAGMHGRGVMHRDIAPANIVLSADRVPCLVGFASAMSLEIRPPFAPRGEAVGTLAYLAPEQTGRIGRAVDQRADLYALGATLYDLATGAPPFGAGDPLRLTHDHLARVPVSPAEANRAVPAPLSAIVMHLLEKEPDDRYQTAEGLLYDLERLRDADGRAAAALRVGERDVPLRLRAPSRLVGREDEVAALQDAFVDALAGRCHGVLVGGAPGVGKTALVDQLRPVVTGRDGWFVAGKFDQYRRDLEFDAVHQAGRALGRLLLAEPEGELAVVRGRILDAVGANAGLVTATSPELAALLAVPPDSGDPLTAQARSARAAVAVVRAVASPKRPLVVFVDDLQWAGRTALGFVDLVFSEEPIEGLLLVGAYREGDADAAHPLAAPLSHWREQPGVRQLRLDNLAVSGSAAMVAEMLHVDPAPAADMAGLLAPHTAGNPYETVELLDALRRAGVLAAAAGGWRWDATAVCSHLGEAETAALSAARLEALPAPSRELVETMACLGGRAEAGLLQSATGKPAAALENALAPALVEGLLVADPEAQQAVRFRHDRLREAVLAGLDPPRRFDLHLSMARRLAGVPELFAAAAEQYLPVTDAVDDPAERRRVVGLLRRAADEATLIGDHARVTTLLTAALPLIEAGETATLADVHARRHAAVFSLGRLEEADAEYHTIEELCPSALDRAEATAVQVRSLTHRFRSREAVDLAVGSLRDLGIAVPTADRLPAEVGRQFEHLYRWLDETDAADDLTRPELADPRLLAAARLLDPMQPAAYLAADHLTLAWVSLAALGIWLEHGPAPDLVGSVGTAAFSAVAMRGDYTAAYRALQRILAVGVARGYEPDTSRARFVFASLCCWFEPLENGVNEALRAREGLLAGGDLANAAYTHYEAVYHLLDCALELDGVVAEVDSALAFMNRTGNEQGTQRLDCYRWLAGVLRGDPAPEEASSTDQRGNPPPFADAPFTRAVAAAVFGDPDALDRHTAAAMPLLPAVVGHYMTAVTRLLRGLVLAGQARDARVDERDGVLAELDELFDWLAARAVDAPENFLHLVRLLEAERAWAVGDFRAAVAAFDAARRDVADRRRPWHRALIAERAARFYLAHGVDQAGFELLAQARAEHLAWGATAKVAQLDWAYPTLRRGADTTAGPGAGRAVDGAPGRSAITTGTIDLLGILSASQALSSETSIERLHTRVVEVLGAMTGATGVHLLLWSEDRHDWLLPIPGGTAPVGGSGHETAVPMSVLRYAQRTAEPLVVGDATEDDRFGRDPYFAAVSCCSLLALPIVNRGELRALLMLENRLIRGAFTAERLDAVKLIAGQLAVSLDNAESRAELTASRRRVVAAADEARRRIQRDLHDGAQQRSVHTILTLELACRALEGVPGEASELVAEALENAKGANEELRELAHGIHPGIVRAGGLGPTLEALARRSPFAVTLDVSPDAPLPEHSEVTAYFVVSEALTNAAKHAHASHVQITIDTTDGDVRLSIGDDGVGGADPTRGSGLVGLKDRVEAVGGTLTVQSRPGQGTRLLATVPLNIDQQTSPS